MTLPNRRPCITHSAEMGGRKFHFSVGYNPETAEIAEIFGNTGKSGSEAQSLIMDIARDWSKAMQDGAPPEYFATRVTRNDDGDPVSSAGLMADVLLMEANEIL